MRPALRFRAAPLRLTLVAALLALAPAVASAGTATEIFTVDTSEGYGIDACLASGASCGQGIADAWCRVHDFERAVSFGKVKSDATPIASAGKSVRTACTGTSCPDTVAITCQ
ncbi:hypothetical protein FHS55_000678 [Angulomicrobium tetraedrale]|uniref:Uncharacterized protein n=1 Tax=Ancylobacter tetraedralis TaxID=217068 RepID=A0A839Z361_9HYPH|nr:hypothetical protein [Ancylobacter tetraedralis]MBB3770092.1 hypothetical protein [Ancylobacter tetraedralis]